MQNGKLLMLRFGGKLMTLHIRDNKLISLQVYEEEKESLVGNIFVGKVQNIAESVNAAFVEIEKGFTCFLPLSEVKNPIIINGTFSGKLRVGDELLVQVAKDAIKTKQPVLTTKLSIAGNYLAASLGNNKLGISSKLEESKKQDIIRYLQAENLIDEEKKCLCRHADTGMVVRTNASSLQDYNHLREEWLSLEQLLADICINGIHRTCFSCLYRNETAYIADLKNFYTTEYDEIVTDCVDIYARLQEYFCNRKKVTVRTDTPVLRFYEDSYPLEKLYSVKTLIDDALQSRVWLKSGGYLVIEPTEALTVIDVNTGKFEAKKDQETVAYHINIEAAEEIAHQLRLRNISGIVIVDFINMNEEKHCKDVLKHLEMLLSKDRIPAKVVDMTPLGLVEITRKRINRPIKELLS